MSLNGLIASWQALSKVAKHTILSLVLVATVVIFGLGCGWFARHESKVWLCQYDLGTDAACKTLVNSPGWFASLFSFGSAENTNTNTANANANASTSIKSAPTANTNANSSSLANNNTGASTAGPNGTEGAAKQSPSPCPTPPLPLTTDQGRRLGDQMTKVQGLIQHHGRVMAFFFEAYYTSICVILFAGAFVAIAMFFIATSGWSQANQYVKTVFVVMSALVAFYGLWPPVFQQEKNISDNKALFLEYETLQNEIASYPVTRSNLKNEQKDPSDFINYVDSELARIGNVAIGFDYTKISYKGAFDSNPKGSPSPSPPTNNNANANKSKP